MNYRPTPIVHKTRYIINVIIPESRPVGGRPFGPVFGVEGRVTVKEKAGTQKTIIRNIFRVHYSARVDICVDY